MGLWAKLTFKDWRTRRIRDLQKAEESAFISYTKISNNNREGYFKDLQFIRKQYENQLVIVSKDHIAELARYRGNFVEQNARLGELNKAAINRADEARDNAIRVEDYYRKRIGLINEFLSMALQTVVQTAERFDILQKNIGRSQVDQKLVGDLVKKFNKIVEETNLSMPSLEFYYHTGKK